MVRAKTSLPDVAKEAFEMVGGAQCICRQARISGMRHDLELKRKQVTQAFH